MLIIVASHILSLLFIIIDAAITVTVIVPTYVLLTLTSQDLGASARLQYFASSNHILTSINFINKT